MQLICIQVPDSDHERGRRGRDDESSRCEGVVAALIIFLFHAIGDAAERLTVFVSILPQRYFVEKIGGERVQVAVMVRPGASPATYEPKPRQMADLSEASVYFAVGVPFERLWLGKIAAANASLRIVPTDAFIREPDRLHGRLQRSFDSKAGRRFMVFHPARGYFARACGLIQVPIEIEGKSPKAAELKSLVAAARQSDIRAIFVQPQFSRKDAELIAREIGAQVILADPLAPDWAANLRRVAVAVASALR